MSDSKTVPVAYVTKWATTRGILVVRGAEEYKADFGAVYLSRDDGLFVGPKQWTTDKAEAEERYRKALKRARDSALKKAQALRSAIEAPPKYSEESDT